MNPANLPNAQDTGPEYGLLRTILFFVVYAALILGAVLYLRWKLPRHGDADTALGDSSPRGPHDDLGAKPD